MRRGTGPWPCGVGLGHGSPRPHPRHVQGLPLQSRLRAPEYSFGGGGVTVTRRVFSKAKATLCMRRVTLSEPAQYIRTLGTGTATRHRRHNRPHHSFGGISLCVPRGIPHTPPPPGLWSVGGWVEGGASSAAPPSMVSAMCCVEKQRQQPAPPRPLRCLWSRPNADAVERALCRTRRDAPVSPTPPPPPPPLPTGSRRIARALRRATPRRSTSQRVATACPKGRCALSCAAGS